MRRGLTDSSRPRFLIADDHAIFAEALCALLEEKYPVLGTVTDGRAMVAEAASLKPDVIVVDVGINLRKKAEPAFLPLKPGLISVNPEPAPRTE